MIAWFSGALGRPFAGRTSLFYRLNVFRFDVATSGSEGA
jgi:hypothetical protein